MQAATTRAPESLKEGQISKANIKKLNAILQGDPKAINWNVIRKLLHTYHPDKKNAPNLDHILCVALGRACRDKSSISGLELILQKLKLLSLQDRFTFAHTAARCGATEHFKAIVFDDPLVLFFKPEDTMPLLHVVCELNDGWTQEVQFLLKVILEEKSPDGEDGWNHDGLFEQAGESKKMPLEILVEAGSDLEEIVDYLKDQYPEYLKANLIRVADVLAWHLSDMDLLIDCITWSDGSLLFSSHPTQGSSLLGLACHHQNDSMVFTVCQQYFEHHRSSVKKSLNTHDSLVRLQKYLLAPNQKGMSPLADLLLSVSNPDAGFAWSCIHEIVNFFGLFSEHIEVEGKTRGQFRFCILHLFVWHTWDKILEQKKCIKTFDLIIDRLEIDLCGVEEETGKTIISIVIEKMAMSRTAKKGKNKFKLSLEILDYFIDTHAAAARNPPATIRNRNGRLPLHSACEYSLPWKGGMEKILNANMPALESVDPITGLPPFAHCAVGVKSDLDSIYELLRLRPDSIDGMSFATATK